jgi:hypothetical protein
VENGANPELIQDPPPDLGHVLWLGGSACAGKTSVARTLGSAYGLRVYHCDEAFDDHVLRADPQRHPGFRRIMRLAGPELWSQPVASQVRDLAAFYRDQMTMIVEDLGALRGEGTVLAEGAGLEPALVGPHLSDPTRALWLIATPELRRRLYPSRGAWVPGMLEGVADPEAAFENWMARDDEMARRRAEQAAERGLAVLTVDGSRTLEATAAEVARRLGLRDDP